MNILSRKIVNKLSKKFWDFEEPKDYPILEVIDIDWIRGDNYIRSDFYLYLKSEPWNYVHVTAYTFHVKGHGIVTEFGCRRLDGASVPYYWVSDGEYLFDKECYDNWEAQLMDGELNIDDIEY